MSNSNVQKGKLLEDFVANQIREKGIDPKAYRSHGSGNGNSEKGDIWTSMMVLGQNVGIECKNQANLAIPEWWRQTKKLEKLGREPVLVFKQFGEPLEETKVVIYLSTFLEMAKGASGEIRTVEVPAEDSRDKKYAMELLKRAVTGALKYL